MELLLLSKLFCSITGDSVMGISSNGDSVMGISSNGDSVKGISIIALGVGRTSPLERSGCKEGGGGIVGGGFCFSKIGETDFVPHDAIVWFV